jgi:DNA-binding GntR family transcriptional regulator
MLPWLSPTTAERATAPHGASLAKLVREDMLGMILHGALQPGQRINEPDVAARLGISRVPVREALRELESSGLVVAKKHCGVFVRQLDAAEIASLYQLRGLLDGYAGRCAAGLALRRRKALVAALDASIAAMNDAAEALDVQRYYGENLRFHWTPR